MTSTSAVSRATPWKIAACAPNRYQRTPRQSKQVPSAASTSPMCEDMRGTVEESFQSKVLGEVPSRVVGRRPLRSDPASMLPQGSRCLDGGHRAPFPELGRPMKRVGVAHRRPVTRSERFHFISRHCMAPARPGRFCPGVASPENIQLPPGIDSVSAAGHRGGGGGWTPVWPDDRGMKVSSCPVVEMTPSYSPLPNSTGSLRATGPRIRPVGPLAYAHGASAPYRAHRPPCILPSLHP